MLINKLNKPLILTLLSLLLIFGVSAIDIYVASLPQMVVEFDTLPTTINLTISAYTLGIAISALFIGEFSNRFGRRRVLLSSACCFTISSWLIAFSPSIYLIICLRLFQAIGCASFIIIPRLIIRDTMDEKEQINATGILLLGMIIAPAISPVFGAYISKYFGWRYCFGTLGIISLMMTYLIYKILPETHQSPLKRLATAKYYLTIYKQLISNSSFLALTTIYATTVGAYFGFIGISSYLYIDSWHLMPTQYAYVYVFMAIAYFVGNFIMRRLNRNGFSPARIIGAGVYSAFIGMVLIAMASLYLENYLLILMVTIGVIFLRTSNAIIIAPTQIRVMNNFAPHSAQALGLNMCLGFISNSFATYIVTVLKFSPLINLMIISILPIFISAVVYAKFKNKI